MVTIFFRKCGISASLCAVILILLIMSGCIEKPEQLDSSSSLVPESRFEEGQDLGSQAAKGLTESRSAEQLGEPDERESALSPSRLLVDYNSQVQSDLFRVTGNLAFAGNSTIPYLLLNATLLQGSRAVVGTKYLLLAVEPGQDHGFEISKNMKIRKGSYDCRLEVTGPQGLVYSETRGCRLASVWEEKSPASVSAPSERTEGKIAVQKQQEEKLLQEKAEVKEDREEPAQRAKVESVKSSAFDDKPSVNEPKPRAENETSGSSGNYGLKEATAAKKGPEQDAKADHDPYSDNNSSLGNNSSSSQAGRSLALNASSGRPGEEESRLVGSKTSKKYHRPDCRYALKIKPENKIFFAGIEDAQKQGYLPCKTCSP